VRTTVVVIGGGQAGLAMSWWLTHSGIDHVVLERGVVAQSRRNRRHRLPRTHERRIAAQGAPRTSNPLRRPS